MMGKQSVASFRTVGNAATAQNLFVLRNTHASKSIVVERVVFQMEATGALLAVMPLVRSSRITAATGGTALTKVRLGKAPSDETVVALGATTADGAALTTITATPAATLWQQYGMRVATAVGQILAMDNEMIPAPVSLEPGEGILVHLVAAAGTSNPATNSYSVQAVWEEA
jgi:hypothetical protein